MSFAERIIAEYEKNPAQRKTAKILVDNRRLGKNATVLFFELGQEQSFLPLDLAKVLIFYKNKFTGLKQFCVPQNCLTKIFQLLHGNSDHLEFAKSFDLAQ